MMQNHAAEFTTFLYFHKNHAAEVCKEASVSKFTNYETILNDLYYIARAKVNNFSQNYYILIIDTYGVRPCCVAFLS